MTNPLTLDDVINQRLRAERLIEDGNRLIDQGKALLSDLEAVERVIKVINGGTPGIVSHESTSMPYGASLSGNLFETSRVNTNNPNRAGTNKAYIWEALNSSPSVWLTANEIQPLAEAIKGSSIPMASISPSLTEMKRDEQIERLGLRVALAIRSKSASRTTEAADL